MLFLDFETRSSVNLITNAAYKYVTSPDADVICLVYGFTDKESVPYHWIPTDPIPLLIKKAAKDGILFAASNAQFDRLVYSEIGVKKYGFPEVPIEQWYCTQAESRVNGLPSKLEHLAIALDLPHKKSSRGAALIRKMSIPPFEHTPEILQEMQDYCERDWIVSVLGHQKLTPLTKKLHEDYVINEKINDRGFCIDKELAVAATEYIEQEQAECTEQLKTLTNGRVQKHTQAQRFRKWLVEQLNDHPALEILQVWRDGGLKYSTDATARSNILENQHELNIPLHVIEAINCYDIASGTATAKYKRLLSRCGGDGRVRGVLRAFGAPSTLRYSSMGVQVHNLYRNVFADEHVDIVRDAVIHKRPLIDPATAKPLSVTVALSRLLRSTIMAAPGKVFVSADWSAIESRVTAWLAGDLDKLGVFLSGECPYCYAAEQIYGRKITKKDNPEERQIGKIVDLACGFLGGVGALQTMSRKFKVAITDSESKKLVDAWRTKHPSIVQYGNSLQNAAERAMRHPHVPQRVGKIRYIFDKSKLCVLLPDNETTLTYPQARLVYNRDRQRTEITALKAAFVKRQEDVEWPRHSLWRGLLLENVVQATCAILLRDLVAAFKDVCVLHVHDEIVLEVPENRATAYKQELERLMVYTPVWSEGLPLHAEANISRRFGK